MTSTTQTTAFRIDVPQADLDDLTARLARVRFPNVIDEDATTGGVPVAFLRRLIDRWRDGFDWRAAEAELNAWGDHRVATVGGVDLHHVVLEGSGGLPVVLLHGWPDSFLRFRGVAPLLAAAGHEVIVPSLPGFPLSGQPEGEISVDLVAGLIHELVTGLGHERYAVHGGDWGSAVAEAIATAHPEAVAALHLADVPYQHQFGVDRDTTSAAENAFLDGMTAWAEKAVYFTVQSAEPTTLSFGLADSPAGLAAWVAGRIREWSQDEIDLDTLITHVSLYWHANAVRSSLRLYSEGMGEWDDADWSAGDGQDGAGEQDWSAAGSWGEAGPLAVPTALALFPQDFGVPPREFAERFFDVRRFTLMPRGGHFGAMEDPEGLAADLVSFLASL